jgi:hypothetical protein
MQALLLGKILSLSSHPSPNRITRVSTTPAITSDQAASAHAMASAAVTQTVAAVVNP